MRRIGTHSFALSAAAWSFERSGDRLVVCACQATVLYATGPTLQGSQATD
jgi:hypothetical protein